ncbi:glycosyl hydrolase [Paenibacillus sp. GCM10023248]|uniref:glycosyl hydrolase n=1 Tax=unclassified Paenibacillus TaxID=185978 RepID=UPI0023786B06|nr:glycosyl hydrolase [Paenibacillus sp. MAHUQ-63]MDD9269169.1 glycosyl hydrolase [Paenibacillus sp. MAHUQ-63]
MEATERLRRQFANPSAEYRSLPFWAWNDDLEEEELKRQVRQMKDQGMGGFFIHSRDGLETVYMSEQWMELVRETVETAEALGMQAWLYDEDRWPSGFAGGLVQARGGDAFRAKGLTMEVLRGTAASEVAADGAASLNDAVALFRAVIRDRELLHCERLQPGAAAADGDADAALLVFRVEVSERSAWFNDEAPPDQLNPDSVQAFIDITYEAYKREVGGHFGKTVRGVFTDEPSIHDRHCKFTEGRGWMPWSWSLPDYFQEKRGYDLLDLVPYLYFNGERSAEVRHDYWRTITERFSESYSKQIGEWCGNHNLSFTGHYLWENNLGTATRVCGAVMPNYRYQHVPGIDMLNEQTNEYITVKQCTSVAHQYDRRFVLTETYGCTGWGFTFEGQRWIGDFQFVLGVNLRSQHLALYSIKGCRKRDYPPVFNYNTSWWKYNAVIEHYFARLSAVLSEGRPVRDVLVLHPASTAWSMIGTAPYGFPARGKDPDVSAANKYGHAYNEFLGKLLRAHYDVDLGDETIMAETGAVRGDQLTVGAAEYRVVVIPEIRTMLGSTFRLLMQFLDGGGRAIAVGPRPAMLEGRETSLLSGLYEHPQMTLVPDAEQAIAALEQRLPRKVSIREADDRECSDFLYMLRDLGDSLALFAVNNNRERSRRVTISVAMENETGHMEEWCALTGEVKAVATSFEDGCAIFQEEFGPADSKLYVWHKSSRQSAVKEERPVQPAAVAQELGPVCKFTRTEPNVLTLDICSYRMAGGEWSSGMEVWQAQRAVREALGMRQVYGNGIEQRYKWIHEPHPQDGQKVEFKFTFQAAAVPQEPVYAVVESAEYYEIQLNGEPVANRPEGWFLDRTFDKIPLPGLKAGENELILSCGYLNRMEVEDIYVIGSFGVDKARRITDEPEELSFGDWCEQGYPHYSGSMIYHFDVQADDLTDSRKVLALGDYAAVTAEVRVNGEHAGHIPWRAANRLDLTERLHKGPNRIEIEVMGSPRNMLGPFHQAAGESATTSWASFRQEGQHFTPDYRLRPYGLFGQINLYTERWKRRVEHENP